MIENIVWTIAFFIHFFTVIGVVYYIYEVRNWYPKPFGWLDQAPFDCRICCTTWTMLISYISVAVVCSNVWYGVCGVLISIGEGVALKYKSKMFEDNEDIE